jgi:lipoate-protein ligase A
LQHGTLLVDVDLEEMFTFLRVPWAKTCAEVVNVAKHKITSLKEEMKKSAAINDVENALIQGFQQSLNIKLVNGELTTYERELAERLRKEKYSTHDWNFHGKSSDA